MPAPKSDAMKRSPPLWADGSLLLDALPIPAAIIECDNSKLRFSAHNNRFAEAVAAWKRALAGDGQSIDRARVEKKLREAQGRQ